MNYFDYMDYWDYMKNLDYMNYFDCFENYEICFFKNNFSIQPFPIQLPYTLTTTASALLV